MVSSPPFSFASLESLHARLSAIEGDAPLLGIDYGVRSVGVATSDRDRRIASPLTTLRRRERRDEVASRLSALAVERNAAAFILGHPLHLNGDDSRMARSARAFGRTLGASSGLPICLWDERMSSLGAERTMIETGASRSKRRDGIDRVAAAWMLQGFLDRWARLASASGNV